MKIMKLKKFSLLLCALTCVFGLTACANNISSDVVKQSAKQIEVAGVEEQLKEWSEDMINYVNKTSEEEIINNAEASINLGKINGKTYVVNPGEINDATIEFYNGWNSSKDDLGKLVSIDEITVEVSDEFGKLCIITAKTTFEARTCEFVFMVDDEYKLISGAINPSYTTGEKMGKAVMNTLIGMGTVFAVLIFISFIISLFKYINVIGDKLSKSKESKNDGVDSVDNAITQIVSNEEAQETDDLELIAVITAAIAASEGTSADGLVVRSIIRR